MAESLASVVFPEGEQFEVKDAFNKAVTNLEDGISKLDRKMINLNLNLISQMEKADVIAGGTPGISKLILLLYELMLRVPTFDQYLQASAAKLFSNISRKRELRPNVTLPIQTLLNYFKFYDLDNFYVKISPGNVNVKELSIALSYLAAYISEEDGQILVEKYRHRIGQLDTNSTLATLIYLRFLPYKLVEKYVDDFYDILDLRLCNSYLSAALIALVNTSITGYDVKLEEHFEIVFRAILHLIPIHISINPNSGYSTELDQNPPLPPLLEAGLGPNCGINYLIKLLLFNMKEGIILDRTKQLIRLLDTIAIGNNTKQVVEVVSAYFNTFFIDRQTVGILKRCNFSYKPLSPIVQSELSPLMIPLFSKLVNNGKYKFTAPLLQETSYVFGTAPELYLEEVVPFALEHSFDYEASGVSTISRTLVNAAIPKLVGTPEIVSYVGSCRQVLENEQITSAFTVVISLVRILTYSDPDSTEFSEAQDLVWTALKQLYKHIATLIKGKRDSSGIDSIGYPTIPMLIALVDDRHKRQLFNNMFDYIMDTEIPMQIAWGMLHFTCQARADGQEVLMSKLLRRFEDNDTPGSEKKRISILLTAARYPHEALVNRVDKLLDIAESKINDEKKRADVPRIFEAISFAITRKVPKEFGRSNPGESDVLLSPLYNNLKIEWDSMPTEVAERAIERMSNLVKPFYEGVPEFAAKGDLKSVKFVGKLFNSMKEINDQFFKHGTIDLVPRTKAAQEYIDMEIKAIKAWCESKVILESSVSMEMVSKAIASFSKGKSKKYSVKVQKITSEYEIMITEDNDTVFNRQTLIFSALMYFQNMGTSLLAEEFDQLAQTAFKLLSNPYVSGNQLMSMIKHTTEINPELFKEVMESCITILSGKHTEYELKTALKIISLVSYILYQHKDMFERMIKALVVTETDPKWGAEEDIAHLINSISQDTPYDYAVADYSELLEFLATCKPTIDEIMVSMITRFILHQTTQIPVSILKKLFDVLVDQSCGNRIKYIRTAAIVLYKHRPHAPHVHCAENEAKYVDRNVDGFWSTNTNAKNYTGPRVYSEKDTVGEFINEYITEEYLRNLIKSLQILHPVVDTDTGRQPTPIFEFGMLWRGLARIIGPRILKLSEEVLQLVESAAEGAGCTAAEYTCVFHDMRHWDTQYHQVMFSFFTRSIHSRSVMSEQMSSKVTYSISADRSLLRFDGIFDVLKKNILESTDAMLPKVLMAATSLITEGGWRIMDKVSDLIMDILPLFTPLSKKPISCINAFASLVTAAREVSHNPLYKRDSITFDAPVFKLINADTKEEADASAVLLSNIISELGMTRDMAYPYILELVPTMLKIVETVSPQYDGNMDTAFAQLGYFPLSDVTVKMIHALFEGAKGKPWRVRQLALVYMKVTVLEHLFALPQEVIEFLMATVIPAFINDENAVCRGAAMDLLSMIVHCKMTEEELAEFAKKSKGDIEKGEQNAVLFAAALIKSVSVAKKCPEWLPPLFYSVEAVYNKGGPLAAIVQDAAKAFWSRHQYLEIPELEDLRFAFLRSYYS